MGLRFSIVENTGFETKMYCRCAGRRKKEWPMAKVKQSVKQKSRKTKKASVKGGGSKGIRIPVYALKGRCPRPLEDGAWSVAQRTCLMRQAKV